MAPTNRQPNEAEETATAQLALQLALQGTSVVGGEPNDEELAALYENRLDSTRRAQIMGHIANNPIVYQRWIGCVEALAYTEELDGQTQGASISSSKELPTSRTPEQDEEQGFLDRLLDWISGHRGGVFGGGFATAAIVLLVVFMFPLQKEVGVQQHLDDAYLSWGILLSDEWAAFPEDKKPIRKYSSSRSFFAKPKPKSEIQQVIETGFKKGVEKIGKKSYKGFGIDIDNLASFSVDQATTLAAEQYYALTQIGQLTSITAIQCLLNPASERITNLYPVVKSLTDQITVLSYPQVQELVSAVEGTADKNTAVCQFTDSALALMSSSDK